MANFCTNCGQQVNPEELFCKNCGVRLNMEEDTREPELTSRQRAQTPIHAGTGEVREGFPQPGFSDRVNHPEILAAVRRTRKASKLAAFFIVPIPLIGFCLYALITGEMESSEAIRYGGFVSLVFLIFAIFSFIKSRPEKSYEAVVTRKYTKQRADKSRDSSGHRARSVDYDYITVARTTGGKTKKIVETDHGVVWAYNHMQVGDRFRYHPQFAFPYELYDKSLEDSLHCVACGTKNPVTADRCRKCGVPLLK